ncbi:uncharacterized protein LY89DRAFT_717934 [Mollisia scopiformis]|uniref:Uncharacterized protein n=1 Tax=Mollisia scopiformis TaxID=149040 RepID=A0A194XDV7_MOLSC|nr:uncharacterized protein LY89DRAFT_717934 [Mollisia scopiformis]KUJ18370.1 hypothetical protein LY89DRAFT_717934 [Mollisia scopiformis]
MGSEASSTCHGHRLFQLFREYLNLPEITTIDQICSGLVQVGLLVLISTTGRYFTWLGSYLGALGLNVNVPLYIQVRAESIAQAALPIVLGRPPLPVYQQPPPVLPAGGGVHTEMAMYRLRLCWYTALETATPVAAIAGLQVAMAMPLVAPAYPNVNAITFPLMGSAFVLGYTYDQAATQACKALYEYFHVTLGSESAPFGMLSSPVAAPGSIEAERNARRAQFSDVYLTIPNGMPFLNPPVGVGRVTINVFHKEMGQQELAWQRAFAKYLMCDCCGSSIE